jgi:hypothetical protein
MIIVKCGDYQLAAGEVVNFLEAQTDPLQIIRAL